MEARRLREAAQGADAETMRAAAAAFVRFFARDTARHFREEEELVFPLLVELADEPPPCLERALVQHAVLRSRAARLERALPDGVEAHGLAEIGELLEAHVRLEERELFPLLEELAGAALLGSRLALTDRAETVGGPVRDLRLGEGEGPLWGEATADLNVTLLAWRAGNGTPRHVNEERDVVVVAVEGAGIVEIDGVEHPVRAGELLVVEKGRSRRISASPGGLRYLSVHRRREGLQIGANLRAPGTPAGR